MSPPKPVVDLKAVENPLSYQTDMIECRVLADHGVSDYAILAKSTTTNMALGAAGGAISSGISGSSMSQGVSMGIVGGIITAPINAAWDTAQQKEELYGACMFLRGYSILNLRRFGFRVRLCEDEYKPEYEERCRYKDNFGPWGPS